MCFGTVKLCYLHPKGVRGNLSAGPSCLHHEQLLCMKEGLLFQFHGSGEEKSMLQGTLINSVRFWKMEKAVLEELEVLWDGIASVGVSTAY